MTFVLRTALACAIGCAAGCLDPLVSDDVPTDGLILPAGTDVTTVPHVEDDPSFAARVPSFTARVDYLHGYANGRATWYWNVPGVVVPLIAPLYVVVGADGARSLPIIDALPGEPGYSPWWRRVEVRTTAAYQGQLLTSRQAIEAALDQGLVEAPAATTTLVTAAVVLRALPPVEVGNGLSVPAGTAFYKGRRVAWVEFSHTLERPVTLNELEVKPVYILQRIDEPLPLYEAAAGADLDGDGKIDDSNNIFARDLDEADYTPQWEATLARVAADVRSIDTSSGTPELTREVDVVAGGQPRAPRVLSVSPSGRLVNCPIQREKGRL